jgi:hypothetical protein
MAVALCTFTEYRIGDKCTCMEITGNPCIVWWFYDKTYNDKTYNDRTHNEKTSKDITYNDKRYKGTKRITTKGIMTKGIKHIIGKKIHQL